MTINFNTLSSVRFVIRPFGTYLLYSVFLQAHYSDDVTGLKNFPNVGTFTRSRLINQVNGIEYKAVHSLYSRDFSC